MFRIFQLFQSLPQGIHVRRHRAGRGNTCKVVVGAAGIHRGHAVFLRLGGWSFLICLIWGFFSIIITISQQLYRESHDVGSIFFQFQFGSPGRFTSTWLLLYSHICFFLRGQLTAIF